jgi:hypothetical protein
MGNHCSMSNAIITMLGCGASLAIVVKDRNGQAIMLRPRGSPTGAAAMDIEIAWVASA